jgi:hypothetical protein
MRETQWLAGKHPYEMIYDKRCRNDRKRRLLSCACARRVLHLCPDERFALAIETSERYADGTATYEELKQARKRMRKVEQELDPRSVHECAREAIHAAVGTLEKEFMTYKMVIEYAAAAKASLTRPDWDKGNKEETRCQCALVRDIFGNLIRPVAILPSWRSHTVATLAQAIYDERAFDRLPVLADALEDAGCDHADILTHCRQGGEHARGCWVVDLLLRKE